MSSLQTGQSELEELVRKGRAWEGMVSRARDVLEAAGRLEEWYEMQEPSDELVVTRREEVREEEEEEGKGRVRDAMDASSGALGDATTGLGIPVDSRGWGVEVGADVRLSAGEQAGGRSALQESWTGMGMEDDSEQDIKPVRPVLEDPAPATPTTRMVEGRMRTSRLPPRIPLPTSYAVAYAASASTSAHATTSTSTVAPPKPLSDFLRTGPTSHKNAGGSSSSPPLASTSRLPHESRLSSDPRPAAPARQSSVASSSASLPRFDSPSLGSPPSQYPTPTAATGERVVVPLRVFYLRGKGSKWCYLVMERESVRGPDGAVIRPRLYLAQDKEVGAKVLLSCIEKDTVVSKANVPEQWDQALLIRFTYSTAGGSESRVTCIFDQMSKEWNDGAGCRIICSTMFPTANQMVLASQLKLLTEVELAVPDLVPALQKTLVFPVKFFAHGRQTSAQHTSTNEYLLYYSPYVAETTPTFSLIEVRHRTMMPILITAKNLQHLTFPVKFPELLEIRFDNLWTELQMHFTGSANLIRVQFKIPERGDNSRESVIAQISAGLAQIKQTFEQKEVWVDDFPVNDQSKFISTLTEAFKESANLDAAASRARQHASLLTSNPSIHSTPFPLPSHPPQPRFPPPPPDSNFSSALFVPLRICVLDGGTSRMKLPGKALSFVQEFDEVRKEVTVSIVDDGESQDILKCSSGGSQGMIFWVNPPDEEHQLAITMSVEQGMGRSVLVQCVFDHRDPAWAGAALREMGRRFAVVGRQNGGQRLQVGCLSLEEQLKILHKLERSEREFTKKDLPDAYIPSSETLHLPLDALFIGGVQHAGDVKNAVFHLYGSLYIVLSPSTVVVLGADQVRRITIELEGTTLKVNIETTAPTRFGTGNTFSLVVSESLKQNARKELYRRIRACYAGAFDAPSSVRTDLAQQTNDGRALAVPLEGQPAWSALESLKRARKDFKDSIAMGTLQQAQPPPIKRRRF